ncbi:MAG: pilus assembly protein PilP [Pseudomonadota bacterium]
MRRLKRKSSFILFISFLICTLWGEAFATEPLIYKESRPLKKIFETRQAATGETGSAEVQGKTYYYDPTGKTDPFKSFIAEQEEVEEKVKRQPKTYLETLDLSQLELIAIIIGPKDRWAMVRDSKGIGHVIRNGTSIGTNGGVVHVIKEGEVTIREEYKDFRGRTKYKDVAKKVPSLR